MDLQYRPLLDVLREALRVLKDEPGPMTPEKSELMRYLQERIAANGDLPVLGRVPQL